MPYRFAHGQPNGDIFSVEILFPNNSSFFSLSLFFFVKSTNLTVMMCPCKSEDNFPELVFSFHLVGVFLVTASVPYKAAAPGVARYSPTLLQ